MNRLAEKRSESDNDIRKNYQIIAAVFASVILGIFPWICNKSYFDMLSFKYTIYYISALILIVLVFIAGLLSAGRGENYKCKIEQPSAAKRFRLTVPETAMICFMLVAIISTLLSDYLYESFWGNEGRFNGCFILILYGFNVIIVSRTLRLKSWILDLFLLAGMIVLVIGITDYYQLNLLGFKDDMLPRQYWVFTSTIGNTNIYTSYVALVMGASAVLFAKAEGKKQLVWYYFCLLISFYAIATGHSDNSILALGAIFALLPFYLFRSMKGLSRYLIIISTFILSLLGLKYSDIIWSEQVLSTSGVLRTLSQMKGLEILLVVMILLSVLVTVLSLKVSVAGAYPGGLVFKVWIGFLVAAAAAFLFVLYDANTGNAARYGGFRELVEFNDDWGTHRGHNWRLAWENYKNFPLKHKLFGSGPETYGIITINNNYYEMLNKYQEAYDNTHNEYLQYFVTMGPLSLISYLTLLISSGWRILKKAGDNPYAVAALFAVTCFAFQALVNISVPIVAPIVFTLLAVGLAATYDEHGNPI